jgi:hypothetical protein
MRRWPVVGKGNDGSKPRSEGLKYGHSSEKPDDTTAMVLGENGGRVQRQRGCHKMSYAVLGLGSVRLLASSHPASIITVARDLQLTLAPIQD